MVLVGYGFDVFDGMIRDFSGGCVIMEYEMPVLQVIIQGVSREQITCHGVIG
jgi:hypothetical protein